MAFRFRPCNSIPVADQVVCQVVSDPHYSFVKTKNFFLSKCLNVVDVNVFAIAANYVIPRS
jgi:hypothetical protein